MEKFAYPVRIVGGGSGGDGGGSAGGGTLIVNAVESGEDESQVLTLDKTFEEISEAFMSGSVVVSYPSSEETQQYVAALMTVQEEIAVETHFYIVATFNMTFLTTSSTGYPSTDGGLEPVS